MRTNRETLSLALSLEKQIVGAAMGKATWEIARKTLHPEVEGVENFAIARAHLRAGGSIIIYLNDPTEKTGVPLVANAIETNLVSLDHAGVFVSRRQVDWRQGKHIPNYAQHLLLESFWGEYPGVTMIRTVQEKDRWRYPDWAEFNAKGYKRAEKLATTKGNAFAITPTAERNPNGLTKAHIGFAALLREARDIALAMPIAVPNGTSKVIAGAPFSYRQVFEERNLYPGMDMTTRMMARLAILLPLEQRGVYAEAALKFVMPPTNS